MLEFLAQLVVNSLMLAGLYTIITIGLSLIFVLMGILDFTHGIKILLAGYICYWVISAGIHPAIALVASVVLMTVLGSGLFEGAVKRVSESHFTTLLVTLGVAYVIEGLVSIYQPPQTLTIEQSVTGLPVPLSIEIAGLKFSTTLVETFVFSFSIMVLFHVLIKRTMFGVTLRALVEDRDTASLMGVNPRTRLLLSVALVSAISGVAGFFYLRAFGGVIGDWSLILGKAFALTLFVGKTTNMFSLFAMALILALTENIIGGFIAVGVKDIAAVFVIIAALIIKYREV
ncbi:MAG: branched-chain amino acid ABC transporter permease [Candidatus Caldarchaeum sp.]|nr:branched-chain amino acid ABC transporter permease [Candidatus Caldarchaeum sp.]